MRLPRPLLAAALAQTALALVLGLAPAPAKACSPPQNLRQFYTFQDSLPADGATGVPRDGTLFLIPRTWQSPGWESPDNTVFTFLNVTVTDTETGQPVAGRLQWWQGEPSGIIWEPDSLLHPNRRYEWVATLQVPHERPEGAQGPTELRKSFTTGTQVPAPLELLGGLSVRLEQGEVDKLDCGTYSCGCTVVGKELGTRARIVLPGVRGGAWLNSYRFELIVTDSVPYQFGIPGSGYRHEVQGYAGDLNTSGPALDVSLDMPRNYISDSYAPCFAWRAIDPVFNVVEGPPVCLTELVHTPGSNPPHPPLPPVPEPGNGVGEEPGTREDRDAFGCAAGAGSTAPLALLGLWATLWRSRRARRG